MFISAINNYYNSLPFQDLCKDFENCKPKGVEIATTKFVTLQFDNENQSSNDVLIKFLIDLNIPYLRDFNGIIWFIFENKWTKTKVNCKDNILYFKRCIFD